MSADKLNARNNQHAVTCQPAQPGSAMAERQDFLGTGHSSDSSPQQVLRDRQVSVYARTNAYECANTDICSYPNLSEELIAQERPCCSQREKCFMSTQSFVYMEIIRLIAVKVQVKESSDVNWIWQAKNMELTCSCVNWWLCTSLSFFIFCNSSLCKRKTH